MSVQYDLHLTLTTADLNSLPAPKKGTGLIGIAKNNNVLYFRVIDSSGHKLVDNNEGSLTDKAQNIKELKERLKGLWPPRVVDSEDKQRVIKAVRSIVSVKEIEDGLGILGKDEWFQLQAFVLQCKYRNPTTVAKMAMALGIESPPDAINWDPEKSEHWDHDFTKTIKNYFDLANYCDDSDSGLEVAKRTGFWNKIKPGMIELADDIVSYQKTQKVIFAHLKKATDAIELNDSSPSAAASLEAIERLWNQPNPSAEALSLKKKFTSSFERLHKEADKRAKKAGELEALVTAFYDNLVKSRGQFELSYDYYKTKYGSQSQAVLELKASKESLEEELKQGRKKERDEIIVLGTSPLYLILWPFGPLIMAGIQIGVGVDLGILRAKINKLVEDVAAMNKKLSVKEKFKVSYESMRTMTEDTSKAIKKVLPAIAQLKDGWHTLAADLEGTVENLKQGGGSAAEENWSMVSVDLETAGETWSELAERADYFRKNATIKEADSTKTFVKELRAA